jgi:hypothetical protein
MARLITGHYFQYGGGVGSTAVNQYKVWVTHIHNTFLLGWVNTSDTGQLDISTLPSLGLSSISYSGYKIYRMNDSLQATYPVYVKVEYGNGYQGLYCPGLRVSFGTGSDGAGNLTGYLNTITISPFIIITRWGFPLTGVQHPIE